MPACTIWYSSNESGTHLHTVNGTAKKGNSFVGGPVPRPRSSELASVTHTHTLLLPGDRYKYLRMPIHNPYTQPYNMQISPESDVRPLWNPINGLSYFFIFRDNVNNNFQWHFSSMPFFGSYVFCTYGLLLIHNTLRHVVVCHFIFSFNSIQ